MTRRIIIAAIAALAVSAATLPAQAGDTPVIRGSTGDGTAAVDTHRQQVNPSFLGQLSTSGHVPARTVPQRFHR